MTQSRQGIGGDRLSSETGMFGKYTLVDKIAEGGIGEIYKVIDTENRTTLALKVLRRDKAGSGIAETQFQAEIESCSRVTHPNMVRVIESGKIDGKLFFVMPFFPGETLRKTLSTVGRFNPERASLIMQRVSLALGHIHRAGVIHCDIKPSNIMLDDSDEPVIIDFGMSIRPNAVDPSHIKTASHGYIVGTPEYMAPEQITGESKNYTPAIDIYAVGATLFELLAGRPPFEPSSGGNAMAVVQTVLTQPAPSVKSLNAGVPDDIDALIRRCLEKTPSKRFQTADELAVKLNDCRRGRALDKLPKKTIARRLSGFFFKEIFLPKKPKDE